MARPHVRGGSAYHLMARLFHLERRCNITFFFCERPILISPVWSNIHCQVYFSVVHKTERGIWKRRHYGCRHWRFGGDGRIWTPRLKVQCKGSVNANDRWKFHIPSRRWFSWIVWRRSGSEDIHFDPGQPRPRRITKQSSRRIRRVFFTSRHDSTLNDGEAKNDFWSISGDFI